MGANNQQNFRKYAEVISDQQAQASKMAMTPEKNSSTNAERARIHDLHAGRANWRDFGPFLSDRQWGTVREDYSADGSAWTYFSHDEARSRAYRWGEDGIAGFCDQKQLLCLSLALWSVVEWC